MKHHLQTVSTKGSDEMVLLPIEEYRELVQQLENARRNTIIGLSRESIIQNLGETFPSDFVKKLLLGEEHPVKVWRDFRGLSQAQLAAESGVRQAAISNIETGKNSGSVHTMQALARALGCTIDLLLPGD